MRFIQQTTSIHPGYASFESSLTHLKRIISVICNSFEPRNQIQFIPTMDLSHDMEQESLPDADLAIVLEMLQSSPAFVRKVGGVFKDGRLEGQYVNGRPDVFTLDGRLRSKFKWIKDSIPSDTFNHAQPPLPNVRAQFMNITFNSWTIKMFPSWPKPPGWGADTKWPDDPSLITNGDDT
ncbi:hypothetical protein F53441_11768 [Fusarium austroafricanum]|uniref:Uncharacterized protein n=1 Tax=Fusarium austroafricanum TaxID=2364996 RepID=A0A8H4K213_9HYPO|nr:hypothetical protein F53441_11768 [Fusarium austroafricanum]